MSWANRHIEKLTNNETVTFRPSGHSMTGRVNHRDLVTVEPLTKHTLVVKDVVLCKVKGVQYLHLIKAIDGDRFLIASNKGRINGWIRKTAIFGKLTLIEK